jgi:hypothetical protein
MGHFGQTEVIQSSPTDLVPVAPQGSVVPVSYSNNSSLFTTASSIAQSSVERTFATAEKLARINEVEQFIKENNLGPYLKDVNKEGIKNILSFLGLIWLMKLLKSPVALAGVGALGIYVYYSNSSKLTSKISEKVA